MGYCAGIDLNIALEKNMSKETTANHDFYGLVTETVRLDNYGNNNAKAAKIDGIWIATVSPVPQSFRRNVRHIQYRNALNRLRLLA